MGSDPLSRSRVYLAEHHKERVFLYVAVILTLTLLVQAFGIAWLIGG